MALVELHAQAEELKALGGFGHDESTNLREL